MKQLTGTRHWGRRFRGPGKCAPGISAIPEQSSFGWIGLPFTRSLIAILVDRPFSSGFKWICFLFYFSVSLRLSCVLSKPWRAMWEYSFGMYRLCDQIRATNIRGDFRMKRSSYPLGVYMLSDSKPGVGTTTHFSHRGRSVWHGTIFRDVLCLRQGRPRPSTSFLPINHQIFADLTIMQRAAVTISKNTYNNTARGWGMVDEKNHVVPCTFILWFFSLLFWRLG